MESGLECRILEPGLPDSDIAACVNAHNQEWSDFFRLTPDIFKRRLDSGELFLGAYKDGELLGFLETTSHRVIGLDEPIPQDNQFEFAKKIAKRACNEIKGSYLEIASVGPYRPRFDKSNVMLLMDINVLKSHRQFGYGGNLVNFLLSLLLHERISRPAQLSDIIVVPTLTPELQGPMNFHAKYGAFDTGYTRENVRPGYTQPRAHYFCYLSPGFVPKSSIKAA